jgi:hypothetical protein
VSFHKDFWLAASAAAPVITLAIVVAIPDAAGIRFRVDRQRGWLEDELGHTPELKAGDTSAAQQEMVHHQLTSSLARLDRAAKMTRRNVRLAWTLLRGAGMRSAFERIIRSSPPGEP